MNNSHSHTKKGFDDEAVEHGKRFHDDVTVMNASLKEAKGHKVNLQTFGDTIDERKVLQRRINYYKSTMGRKSTLVAAYTLISMVIIVVVGVVAWYIVQIANKRKKGPGVACTTEDDCGKGQMCLGAHCSSPKSCSIKFVSGKPTTNCPSGSNCVGGMCQPTKCTLNSDCANSGAEGKSVVCGDNHTCALGCRSTKDCPLGESSNPIGADGSLTAGRDCSSKGCAAGEKCVALNGGGSQCVVQCTSSRSCPKDAPCVDVFGNGSKVCAAPSGGRGVCDNGACVSGTCKKDSDCIQDGTSCVPINNETNGLRACKIKCTNDTACPNSMVCKDVYNSGVPVCSVVLPSLPSGGCSSNTDCAEFCKSLPGTTSRCTKNKKCVCGTIPTTLNT